MSTVNQGPVSVGDIDAAISSYLNRGIASTETIADTSNIPPNYITYLEGTFDITHDGCNYKIDVSYLWAYNSVARDFFGLVILDEGLVTEETIFLHQQEPKDASLTQKNPFSYSFDRPLVMGTHTVTIKFAAQSAGDIARMHSGYISIERWM